MSRHVDDGIEIINGKKVLLAPVNVPVCVVEYPTWKGEEEV
jgi:hypothetical protein